MNKKHFGKTETTACNIDIGNNTKLSYTDDISRVSCDECLIELVKNPGLSKKFTNNKTLVTKIPKSVIKQLLSNLGYDCFIKIKKKTGDRIENKDVLKKIVKIYFDSLQPFELDNNYVIIHKCLGSLAHGNLYEAHKNCTPGGYDVDFKYCVLNDTAPFTSFKEAKGFALMFLIQLPETINTIKLYNHIFNLKEEDCFDSTYAYNFLKSKINDSKKIILGGDKTSYGWLYWVGKSKKTYHLVCFDENITTCTGAICTECSCCLARKEMNNV